MKNQIAILFILTFLTLLAGNVLAQSCQIVYRETPVYPGEDSLVLLEYEGFDSKPTSALINCQNATHGSLFCYTDTCVFKCNNYQLNDGLNYQIVEIGRAHV